MQFVVCVYNKNIVTCAKSYVCDWRHLSHLSITTTWWGYLNLGKKFPRLFLNSNPNFDRCEIEGDFAFQTTKINVAKPQIKDHN